MGSVILKDILIIFIVSVPVVLIAHRLKFPAIVGFLITGCLIGPHALRLVPDVEEIRVLADVSVALLLFSIGLEFSFDRLKGWGRQIIGMGTIQVVVTMTAGFFVGRIMGFSSSESAFLGAVTALSSTAIVMSILSNRRWFDSPAGRISTGILILQDIAVIPIMIFLKVFVLPKYAMEATDFAVAGAKLVALAAIFFILSRWVLEPFLRHTSLMRSKELFVVVIVGLAIAASYATEQMGFSFALGAFLAGLLVSTTDFKFHALSEIAPFRYCFSGLFFVAAGMMVDLVFVAQNWQVVFLIIVVMVAVKILIVWFSVFGFGYPVSIATVVALMLAQVGEFSFMLLFFGWKAGAISTFFAQVIITSAAITMIFAPFLVALAPKFGEKLAQITWRIKRFRGVWQEAPDEEETLRGHAIICGFGPLGMTVAKLLERLGARYVVLELNPANAERVRQSVRHVYIGDGASAALLNHSGIDKARLMAIAVPDHLNAMAIIKQARNMNPDIYIVTRSRYRNQVEDLYSAGADVVISEELEGGIEMGRYILERLGVKKDEVAKVFEEIRSFGSADFF